MKIFKLGDCFMGKSHASMINDTIGTNFQKWFKCTVNLDDYGANDVIAWFVYMDGTIHGYPDGWEWANRLSTDGNVITETYMTKDRDKLLKKREEDGYYPYRLAFQLDPNKGGNRYFCKFVGAFCFSGFTQNDYMSVKYTKVTDQFKLGDKGAYNAWADGKEVLMKDKRLLTNISELGFSEQVYRILNNGKISTVAELLELGIGISGSIAEEIRRKIYECFSS